eukprot:XP_005632344.1 collagen alpha-1(I) chain-like [Canis lupus familiaris]
MQRVQWAMQGPGVNRLGQEKLHWSWGAGKTWGSLPEGQKGKDWAPPGPRERGAAGERRSREPRGPAGERTEAGSSPPGTHTPFFQGAWPRHPKDEPGADSSTKRPPERRSHAAPGRSGRGPRRQGRPGAPRPRPEPPPCAARQPRVTPVGVLRGRARGRQLQGPGLACSPPSAQRPYEGAGLSSSARGRPGVLRGAGPAAAASGSGSEVVPRGPASAARWARGLGWRVAPRARELAGASSVPSREGAGRSPTPACGGSDWRVLTAASISQSAIRCFIQQAPTGRRQRGVLLRVTDRFCFRLPMQFKSAWSCWTVGHDL